jgi:hypothetical protein
VCACAFHFCGQHIWLTSTCTCPQLYLCTQPWLCVVPWARGNILHNHSSLHDTQHHAVYMFHCVYILYLCVCLLKAALRFCDQHICLIYAHNNCICAHVTMTKFCVVPWKETLHNNQHPLVNQIYRVHWRRLESWPAWGRDEYHNWYCYVGEADVSTPT